MDELGPWRRRLELNPATTNLSAGTTCNPILVDIAGHRDTRTRPASTQD
jgi:hypothetical protein